MLEGAITAIVTPMHNDGTLDFASMERLLAFQVKNGINGLVIGASTGESVMLSLDEKIKLIKFVIKIVAKQSKKKIAIIAGVSCPSTQEAVIFVQQLDKIAGIHSYMVVAPAYVRPTQDGIYAHFAAIAKATSRPIILYNVPSRTSCNIADDTVLKLALDFKNIIGLKDATGDINRCIYLAHHRRDGFALYCGEDTIIMPFIFCGGNGVISVLSNIIPSEINTLCESSLKYKVSEAHLMNDRIFELYRSITVEPNPIPVKWSLYHMGVIATPTLRLPLTELSLSGQKKLKPILKRIINEKNY